MAMTFPFRGDVVDGLRGVRRRRGGCRSHWRSARLHRAAHLDERSLATISRRDSGGRRRARRRANPDTLQPSRCLSDYASLSSDKHR